MFEARSSRFEWWSLFKLFYFIALSEYRGRADLASIIFKNCWEVLRLFGERPLHSVTFFRDLRRHHNYWPLNSIFRSSRFGYLFKAFHSRLKDWVLTACIHFFDKIYRIFKGLLFYYESIMHLWISTVRFPLGHTFVPFQTFIVSCALFRRFSVLMIAESRYCTPKRFAKFLWALEFQVHEFSVSLSSWDPNRIDAISSCAWSEEWLHAFVIVTARAWCL